jgi:hypothetical protein
VLLLTVLNALTFWDLWGSAKPEAVRRFFDVGWRSEKRHVYAVFLLVLGLLPALLATGFAVRAKIRKKAFPFIGQFLIALACVAYLGVFFFFPLQDTLWRHTPDWMFCESFHLWQLAAMTPGIFLALWRLAAHPLPLSTVKDFIVSILATFGVPIGLYLGFLFMFKFIFGYGSSVILICGILIVGTIIFYLGLLRLLMLIWRVVSTKNKSNGILHSICIFIVAFVLPIGGLLLNEKLPFPADYQNPWFYVLVVLNAFALLAPIFLCRKKISSETVGVTLTVAPASVSSSVVRILALITLALRWALFPFSLYFFVVFLPFAPFSILAILCIGVGFLILSPTLLFILHFLALRQDVAEWKGSRRKGFAFAALAAAALPLGFIANAEYDRYALRTLFSGGLRDYSVDSSAPVSPQKARRILRNAESFRDGAQIPYLDNWYNWRVFNNLMLSDGKFAELWSAFVGKEDVKKEERKEQGGASAWEALSEISRSRSRVRGRSMGSVDRRWSPRPPDSELVGTTVTVQRVSELETEARVCLKVRAFSNRGVGSEYNTPITLPPGVWVSGLKLKIDGKWEDGKIIERKAAEWVYRRITAVSQDPAFLRYEADGSLRLSVFPVDAGQGREVEISFLFPTGLADSVKIGDRTVHFDGAAPVRPMLATAAGVVATNGLPSAAAHELRSETCLIVDCSKGQNWAVPSFRDKLKRLASRELSSVGTIIFSNYKTFTLPVSVGGQSAEITAAAFDDIFAKYHPAEYGGFNINDALRRASRYYALRFNESDPATWRAPVFVVVNNRNASGRFASDVGSPNSETRAALRNELPMLDIAGMMNPQTDFVPLRIGEETRWLPVVDAGLCIFTGDAAVGNLFDANGQFPAFFTKNAVAAVAAAALPEVRLPATSRWAQGAAAWRLQRRYEEAPAAGDLRRDILRISRDSGVMTSAGAYIVVENNAQWKMLDSRQRQTLARNDNLEVNELRAPAPDIWVLLLCVAVFFFARKLWRKVFRASVKT